jgi:hypothetical protein
MANATISAIGSSTVDSTNNLVSNNLSVNGFTTTGVGKCMILIAITRSATVSITGISGNGVADWEQIGVFSFAANGTLPAQTFSVFAGKVTSVVSSQTLTATASASVASIAVGYAWREITTSAVSAGTSWVVEASGLLRNTTSSTNLTMPTLVPGGSSRAYISYGDPAGTATATGITAGYASSIDSMGNQWITNLSVSTSQSPIGKQTTSTTSDCIGLLIYATEADTSLPTVLNIGSAGGKNHFKLQLGLTGYTESSEIPQSALISGYNTDPHFVRVPANSSAQLSVRADGSLTSGTTFPRCELREMDPDGVTEFAFNANSGIHWIRGRTKITSLGTVRPRVTVCQLHDGPSNVGEVLTIYTQENTGSGLTELRTRVFDTGTGQPKLSTNYTYGDEFDWMLYINAGYWAFYYQDLSVPFWDSVGYAAGGGVGVFSGSAEYYFKAGSYCQTNETFDTGTIYTTVELKYLRHWHTGWTTADALTLPSTDEFMLFFQASGL